MTIWVHGTLGAITGYNIQSANSKQRTGGPVPESRMTLSWNGLPEMPNSANKRIALVKFAQRIPPRWYRIDRGGFWHIVAMSRHNVMRARKKGWKVKIMSVWYASKETAGNNDEGVCEHKDAQTPQQMQPQLW